MICAESHDHGARWARCGRASNPLIAMRRTHSDLRGERIAGEQRGWATPRPQALPVAAPERYRATAKLSIPAAAARSDTSLTDAQLSASAARTHVPPLASCCGKGYRAAMRISEAMASAR